MVKPSARIERIAVQPKVPAILVDLRLRERARIVELDVVVVADDGQHRVLPDRLQILHVVSIAVFVAEGAEGIAAQILVGRDDRGAVERSDVARVDFDIAQERVIAAVGDGQHSRLIGTRILGEQVDRTAEGVFADVGRRAGTALDVHAAQHLGREVAGRMMGRAVGVTKGNAIVGDVVLAVLETAQRNHLRFAQARAASLDVGHARRDIDDGGVIGRRRDRVIERLGVDVGLRLNRVQFAVDGGDRQSRHRVLIDLDFGQPHRLLVGRVIGRVKLDRKDGRAGGRNRNKSERSER